MPTANDDCAKAEECAETWYAQVYDYTEHSVYFADALIAAYVEGYLHAKREVIIDVTGSIPDEVIAKGRSVNRLP